MSEKNNEEERERGFNYLNKAGEHFLMGATEVVIGTGFAIKAINSLLHDDEGKKFLRSLPLKAAGKGFGIALDLAGAAMKSDKKSDTDENENDKGKKKRKINIE